MSNELKLLGLIATAAHRADGISKTLEAELKAGANIVNHGEGQDAKRINDSTIKLLTINAKLKEIDALLECSSC